MATTRLWHTTTLAEELKVAEATEDDLYQALDWLLARQAHIEKKLAQRHPHDGSRSGGETPPAVRPLARGPGGGPRHAHRTADR